MTAPVEMQPLPQKINMTKPVLTEGNDNTWIVSFIMPNEFTLETLPKPNNKNIKIKKGTRVSVPFGKRILVGVVTKNIQNPEFLKKAGVVKEIISVMDEYSLFDKSIFNSIL